MDTIPTNITILDHFKFLWDGSADDKRFIVMQGGAGSGKAVTKDTKVVTPYGYKTIKELQVGDVVCTIDGSVTKVIQKWHPETHKVYKITFADGRTCCAGEEHLWKYCIDNKVYKSGKKWKIGTTEAIKQMMGDKKSNVRRKNFYIPIPDPVYFLPKGKLKINPYLLGLLLGDGCFTQKSSQSFITVDEEIRDYLSNLGLHYTIDSKSRNTPAYVFNTQKFKKDIISLGLDGKLSDTKFIPEQYKYASIEDRWELLRGLMDTDGTCGTDGTASFCTISKQLADDACWVVRSLGGYCSVTPKKGKYYKNGEVKECHTAYVLYIRMKTETPLFHLKRKQDRVKPYNGGKCELKLKIDSIEEIPYTDNIYCIAVEDASSLFMIEDFIVTHNSKSLCQRIVYMLLTYADLNIYIVRASMPILKRSVYIGPDPSIYKELSIWGVPATEWLNKSENTIKNPYNGSVITFIGLDNPEKIKSINANYIWIEEATELNTDKFNQLNLRLRRDNPIPGKINQMFISYNPISYNNWVIRTFHTNVTPDLEPQIYRHFSNFTQNKFVKLENVKSWLNTAQNNEQFYQTYILGIPGVPMGQIYQNFSYSASVNWDARVWDMKPFYGIDWGFIDPMVLVECRILEDTLYVRCLFHETERKTADLINLMKKIGINSSNEIYYDSAEADRGAELLNAGFTAYKAMKNIKAGISYLQGLKVVFDDSGDYGEVASKEILAYTWQKDPDDQDKYLDEPIETDNHVCLTGDTLVTTERGDIPIKDIRPGIKVLTRQGYKLVTDWALTSKNATIRRITTENGYSICCTDEHKIWEEVRQKFIFANSLTKYDMLCTLNKSNMTERYGINTPNLPTVPGRVVENIVLNRKEDVYDITVEGAHEFFANGILVSNCDAIRYAAYTKHLRSTDVSVGNLGIDGYKEKYNKMCFDPNAGSGSKNVFTPY
jgi:PBSX family phage terminase large subunit